MDGQTAKDNRRARRLMARTQRASALSMSPTTIRPVAPKSASDSLIDLFLQSNFPTIEQREKAKLQRLVFA